ncbi:Glycine cleavage system T protein (aminomethyltransferase) [Halalkaliarchaeum sp. AArc-CO]|uniref:glycine cleavage T C-terminal barrel domain-containing protein n=1 Tax=Halalkaliarchaeum sp. AArc-CO TaxID=2866381 RepID=UPI00217CD933|nr:glycine cleavage T C-terminal barrel domain-containing protein [Halalkaliarchaeum sp. AArc-CO]UWG50538.1 Glycine cleavage system T protein (aminomethyltransferase) [Halalkaliarchaeum sp. AArc-CO]
MSNEESPAESDSHPNVPSVDQSDRIIPRNLRQSGDPGIEMLISTRVRKSPFWHLSVEEGCWRATVYNRMYHPRGMRTEEEGGAMAEYNALVNRVTLWNVAVERQIRVAGPEAEDLVNYVITRDATEIEPMHGKYVILCNEDGGILNDPVLLRLAEDEFWFSISDSTLMQWLQGVNVGEGFDVEIDEIDVSPMQIQGPLSTDVMEDLFGDEIHDIPYYGLMEGEVNGCPVLVSQTGFSGEKGFEIYVRDSMENAEAVWNPVLERVKSYDGEVIAPAHHRRIAAGILSWGQDMDHETSPFQVNLAYQVPDDKEADYVGKEELERQRELIEAGESPFNHELVGLKLGGEPIRDYAPDFWLVADPDSGEEVGYLTSPWWSPELETNIALGFVPVDGTDLGTEYLVHLPDEYAEEPGEPVEARVAQVPFKESVHPSAREKAKMDAEEEASE